MVKAAWFRNYAPSERPEKFDRIVQSWDTANKASELSDFSVCTTWGIKGKDLYLLHVLRKRMEYPELKRAVREQCEAFDDKASGTQLIQELIDWFKQAASGPTSNAGIWYYYKQLAEQARAQPARLEPLSVMAKRLGLLRWRPRGRNTTL